MALTPALTALLVAINVTLVVTDIAELGLKCALVARQIGGVSCCCTLAATANVFMEPGPVTDDIGALWQRPARNRPEVSIVMPQVLRRPRHNMAMVQDEVPWAYEHSVDCGVSMEFAWDFWTNVQNWALDADVESIEINGPFATGTHGCTNSKNSGRIEWRLVDVRPGRAVIEFPLSGAVGRCVWTFVDIAGCTRITQRWTLQGDQADLYAKAVAPGLEAGIPAGMKKLCRAMEDAARFD